MATMAPERLSTPDVLPRREVSAPAPAAAAPPPRRRRWRFTDRPIGVKFTMLISVVVLSLAGLFTAMFVGNANVQRASEQVTLQESAQELVLLLGTRASELKVSAYMALVREALLSVVVTD